MESLMQYFGYVLIVIFIGEIILYFKNKKREKALSQKETDLLAREEKHKTELSDHTEANKKLLEEKKQDRETIDQLLRKNNLLQQEIASLKKSASRETDSLQQENTALKNTITQKNEQLAGMAHVIDELQIAVFNMQHEYSDQKAVLDNREKSLSQSERQAKQVTRALDELLFSIAKNMRMFRGYTHWYEGQDITRVQNMLRDNVSVISIENVIAVVESQYDGAIPHRTSLLGCDCKDFDKNLKQLTPCKHMYALAFSIGLMRAPQDDNEKTRISSFLRTQETSML